MLILSHGFLAGIGFTIGYRQGKGSGDIYMPSPGTNPLAGERGRNKGRKNKRKEPPDPLKVPPARFNIPSHTAFKGPKNAPITIIEFADFQCPYCATVRKTIKQVMDSYPNQVRLGYMHMPLNFHKQAPLAAEAAQAAKAQGKFWPMWNALYDNLRNLSPEKIDQLAEQIGLNMKKFRDELKSKKYKAQVDQDKRLARRLRVRGTPTFLINGRMLNRIGLQNFHRVIQHELKLRKKSGILKKIKISKSRKPRIVIGKKKAPSMHLGEKKAPIIRMGPK